MRAASSRRARAETGIAKAAARHSTRTPGLDRLRWPIQPRILSRCRVTNAAAPSSGVRGILGVDCQRPARGRYRWTAAPGQARWRDPLEKMASPTAWPRTGARPGGVPELRRSRVRAWAVAAGFRRTSYRDAPAGLVVAIALAVGLCGWMSRVHRLGAGVSSGSIGADDQGLLTPRVAPARPPPRLLGIAHQQRTGERPSVSCRKGSCTSGNAHPRRGLRSREPAGGPLGWQGRGDPPRLPRGG
jgi:hypothetical protein